MNNLTLGRRIRAHRVAAGLSLRELSSRVPVSAQALSQYEKGRTRPRSEILGDIAVALGTRVEQLLRAPEDEWLGSAQIRDLSVGRRKTLDRAQGSLLAMTERSLVLEQRLGGGFPSPTLPVMEEIRPIRDAEDAEELAQDVRRRWGLGTGPLPKLVSLLEARGVRVFELLQHEDVAEFRACAASVWFPGASGPEFPVILVNGGLSDVQKRFALCHELAHMILPNIWRHVLPVEAREECANWFAGALLLPAPALRDQLGRRRRSLSWYELGEIQRQFGVGYYWIARRCRETRIISRDGYRELLEQYRRGDWTEGPGREESSTRLRRLAVRAITEGVATPEEAAALLGVQEKEFETLLSASVFAQDSVGLAIPHGA